MWLLLLPSRTRGGTTMTSRRDRVVRAGRLLERRYLIIEAGECSPRSACRRGIVSRCVLLSLREERETSERCLVLFDLCSVVTNRDRWTECSWSERLPVWPMPNGLPVWPMPEDQCPECRRWMRLVCPDIRTVRVRKVLKDLRMLWQMFNLQSRHVA